MGKRRSSLTVPHNNLESCFYYVTGDLNGLSDVVFIMDTSDKIGNDNFQIMRAFVVELVGTLDVTSGNIKVALITFSDDANLEFNLDRFNTKYEIETREFIRHKHLFGSPYCDFRMKKKLTKPP